MSAAMSSAPAWRAAVRTMTPNPAGLTLADDVAEALALRLGKAPRDALSVGVGDEDEVPPRERRLAGEAGALGPHGILGDLDKDLVPLVKRLFDAQAPPAPIRAEP